VSGKSVNAPLLFSDDPVLNQRFEQLVLNRPVPRLLNPDHLARITQEFSEKSLVELQEMVQVLAVRHARLPAL
jgi:hypothetical protein